MHCCARNAVAAPAPDADPGPGSSRAPSSPAAPAHVWRRIAALLQWAIPVTILALLPKCPACIAAYALLLTGFSVSYSGAAAARWVVISVCIIALAALAFSALRRTAALGSQSARFTFRSAERTR